MLWHDQCDSPPYTNCSFRAICLAIIVFFPTAKAGDTRLAQTHHSRLIWSFRVQRTMQEIKTKLLVEYANWESIQNPYAAPLFFFQAEGLYTPVLVPRASLHCHSEVSCHRQNGGLKTVWRRCLQLNRSPKHKVFLWKQVNALGSLRLERYSMIGQK